MSPEVFAESWPYVDSVYIKLQQELLQQNGTIRVQKYKCRLCKSKKSGAYNATDSKFLKSQYTSICDQYLCQVRIKVSCPVDGLTVVIE